MATFGEFARLHGVGERKRITYACGEERALVEEVVDAVRLGLDADVTSLVAGEDPDREILASVNQYAIDPRHPRLTIVRDAERIRAWGKLLDWMESRLAPASYCLLVGGSDWPHRVEVRDRKRVKVWEQPEVRERIVKSGRYVECSLPKDPERRLASAAELICGWGAIEKRVAGHLYERTGGDLARCRDAMSKASLFPGEASERVIDFLTPPTLAEEYAGALIARHAGDAASAGRNVPPEQVGQVLGRVESDLLLLARLNRAQRREVSVTQLSSTLGEHRVRIEALLPHARHYDPRRVTGCASALLATDAAVRGGAREGALEMLALTW